jgi:DNA-binding GntR family transcriptional regulator
MNQPRPTRPKLSQNGLLYKTIALELRRRVSEGVYAPGSKLPGLRELVEEFRVSTITVRRALRELTSEGLILGQQGLGVFIKPKRTIHRLLAADPDNSIGDEIRRAGLVPEFQEGDFRQVKADADIAERLSVRVGSNIYRHEKFVSVSHEVLSQHTLHIPPALALRLRDGLTRQFIFRLLKEQNIAFTRTRFEFSSSVIDQALSPVFDLPVGFPLLQVRYTPVEADGTALLTGVTICRADMFVFDVDIPVR